MSDQPKPAADLPEIEDGALGPVGLYVHVPFCRHKCIYCDFNSYAGQDRLVASYVKALVAEIEAAGGDRPSSVEIASIYLGGGTPTLLSPAQIGRILEACQRTYRVSPSAEITLEANPGTVDAVSLAELHWLGINRLSLGVQCLSDQTLQLLGRIHNAAEAVAAFEEARRAGFENVNLDLIYALPSQTLEQWQDTLCHVVALEPEHLSLYALTVEEGTPLYEMLAAGRLPYPDEDLAADMYQLAEEYLAREGYHHYEISNWAKASTNDPLPETGLPRLASRHNLTYWRYYPYRGFGAGAHSFDGQTRRANEARPDVYINRIEAGESVVTETEPLDEATRLAEAIILGLRLTPGIDYRAFESRFGTDLSSVYSDLIKELVAAGLVESAASLRLTARGRLLGNEVFARFLPA
jgi:oxygen-independent coproporphyrinogen-3 oxidase